MGLSVRRQGPTPALSGDSENGGGAQGRPVPQPRRRTATRRRFCQGHHALQRIPVGGFSAPKIVAQERGSQFRKVPRKSAGFGKKQGSDLSAGLVRTGVRRLGKVNVPNPTFALPGASQLQRGPLLFGRSQSV